MTPFFKQRWFVYANLVLAFILSNLAMSRANCRMDLSRGGVNSITSSTEKVLEGLDEPVLFEIFCSRNLPGSYRTALAPHLSMVREMARAGGDRVRLIEIDPDTPEMQQAAEARGIRGQDFGQVTEAEASVRRSYCGISIQHGDEQAAVDLMSVPMNPLEYTILKEIKRMQRDGGDSGIGIVSLPGTAPTDMIRQGAPLDKTNYFYFRRILEEDRGEVDDVFLDGPVPASIETLIVVGLPQLLDTHKYYLDQFLMRGGNVVVMAQAFDFQMQPHPKLLGIQSYGALQGMGYATVPTRELQNFNDWLGQYGVLVNGQIVLDLEHGGQAFQDPLNRNMMGGEPVSDPYLPLAFYLRDSGNFSSNQRGMGPVEGLVMLWFSPLDVRQAVQPDVEYEEFLRSSDNVMLRESTGLDYSQVNDSSPLGDDQFAPEALTLGVWASGRFQSAYDLESIPEPLADEEITREDLIERHRPGQVGDSIGHLVVIGSPYLVSDFMIAGQQNVQYYQLNQAFLSSMIESLAGDTDLIAARANRPEISVLQTDSALVKVVVWLLFVIILPGGVALIGVARLYRRNRRRGMAGGDSE